jgi:uncharacterized protein (TIGR02646 family)
MIIRRSLDVPALRRYQQFKRYLRADFRESCAYCLLHESHLSVDYWSFTIDHFRPKAMPQFRHLRHVYANLYYACPQCNTFKRSRWPASSTLARGSGFVDPCAQDPMDHFVFSGDGRIAPRTPAGAYTIRHVRLNRTRLIQLRRDLIEQVASELDRYAQIQEMKQWIVHLSIPTDEKQPRLETLDSLSMASLARLRRLVYPAATIV